MQLLFAVIHSDLICAVDHPNQTVSRLKIVSPVRTQRFLAANIPDVQFIAVRFKRKIKTEVKTLFLLRIKKTISKYSLCSKVFILNPSVGLIVFISSPLNRFRIVVLPALSSPLFGLNYKTILEQSFLFDLMTTTKTTKKKSRHNMMN
jgi:hypothetical protein